MNTNWTPPISLLPNSNIHDIKDGWRNIAETLKYNKGIVDDIWVSLRKLLGSPESQKQVNKDSLKGILVAIEKHRARIIELLADKECVRIIVGANKHVREERKQLAGQILTELEWKIQEAIK